MSETILYMEWKMHSYLPSPPDQALAETENKILLRLLNYRYLNSTKCEAQFKRLYKSIINDDDSSYSLLNTTNWISIIRKEITNLLQSQECAKRMFDFLD